MNANQLINMVMRQVTRRLVNGGIDAGINAFSKRKAASQKQSQDGPWGQGASDDVSDKGKAQVGFDAKQVKRAMRVKRRMTKF